MDGQRVRLRNRIRYPRLGRRCANTTLCVCKTKKDLPNRIKLRCHLKKPGEFVIDRLFNIIVYFVDFKVAVTYLLYTLIKIS